MINVTPTNALFYNSQIKSFTDLLYVAVLLFRYFQALEYGKIMPPKHVGATTNYRIIHLLKPRELFTSPFARDKQCKFTNRALS
jgi:hypothetical protein